MNDYIDVWMDAEIFFNYMYKGEIVVTLPDDGSEIHEVTLTMMNNNNDDFDDEYYGNYDDDGYDDHDYHSYNDQ